MARLDCQSNFEMSVLLSTAPENCTMDSMQPATHMDEHQAGLQKVVPMLAMIGSLLLIIAGTIGLILLQKPLSETQDVRSDASYIASTDVKSCNESCSNNGECEVDHFCFEGKCRLADNPGSSTCTGTPDQGLSFGCNEYCADSSECADEFDCFENRCRRPDSPDDSLCRVPSATIQQNIANTCNDSCASNADCELNMRCYAGACRLATNPTSTTCSTAPAKVMTAKPSPSPVMPKGGDAMMDKEATDSMEVGGYVMPSPSLTPSPTPQTSIPADESAMDGLMSSLGLPPAALPVMALGLGGLVILAILIPKLFSRRPKAHQVANNEVGNQSYEQQLQAKLEDLKKQQAATPTMPEQPAAPATPAAPTSEVTPPQSPAEPQIPTMPNSEPGSSKN